MSPGDAGFYARPEAEQVRGLAQLGGEALRLWDLADAKLLPAAYRENMTFRVEAGGRGRFALRIHQARYRSDDEIRSELAFMGLLGEHGVPTPEVVPARDGSPFVVVESPAVPEARQCDLFEWIEGRPLRRVGDPMPEDPAELAAVFGELGRQAAAIANVAEHWERPDGFTRPVWDAEGIFGERAHLGDWRKLARLGADQRRLFERLAERLRADLSAFGRSPDRYGVCHGDFLPENLMVCDGGLRLLDFDDCGESWYLFDFATGLFDLLGEAPFEACRAAMVAGYRERRALPDDHLARLPAFFLARTLSYLGWSATRSHLDKASEIAPRLLGALEAFAPAYLAEPGP
ncbi:MAG: phosphotransferase [Myxococcota bacterium]|nr:phosphotransferase [Myxococcota bacterium]